MSNKFKIFLVFTLLIVLVVVINNFSSNRSDRVQKREEMTNQTKVAFNYLPKTVKGEVVYHNYYSLEYSEKDEQARWVAYKITSDNFNSSIKRKDNFREDAFVSTQSAQLSDYRKSGYDRGHLAPAGSMKINTLSMSESFFMSNMSPQIAGFNRGIWKKLEEEIRRIAKSNDSIFVVTGPILTDPIGFIGKNKVPVPKAYYKTILAYQDGKPSGIGFILPHEKSSASVYSFSTSIDEVEKITGIDFYYQVKGQSDFESTAYR
mgnify:CR=1 FL=1